MLSLSATPEGTAAIWLAEPAHHTTAKLKDRLLELIEALFVRLEMVLNESADEWVYPESDWRVERTSRRGRTVAADGFRGFDPTYPVPLPSEIRVHRHSAARLQLAEQLRQRLAASGDAAPMG
jgi:hypothetical protein